MIKSVLIICQVLLHFKLLYCRCLMMMCYRYYNAWLLYKIVAKDGTERSVCSPMNYHWLLRNFWKIKCHYYWVVSKAKLLEPGIDLYLLFYFYKGIQMGKLQNGGRASKQTLNALVQLRSGEDQCWMYNGINDQSCHIRTWFSLFELTHNHCKTCNYFPGTWVMFHPVILVLGSNKDYSLIR